MAQKVLLVDDEKNVRKALAMTLRKSGYEISEAENGTDALAKIDSFQPEVMLLDLRMPQMDGMEILRRMNQLPGKKPKVVMMTAYGSASDVMEAMRLGAFDYVQKPFDLTVVKQVVANALQQADPANVESPSVTEEMETAERSGLIGLSPAMRDVYKLVGKVSMTKATVLLQGESGTGKELIARAIHFNSPRADKPIIPVNCGAIPENLLESELFGYERGAFTGAVGRKRGMFELAHEGTLFLDEVGELSPALQVKLLRVLEERKITRLGGVEPIEVDVRLIAATNRNLRERVREGLFREDLYYRLHVVQIHLPPLRERKEDIPLLINHFLAKYGREAGKTGLYLSPEASEMLMKYPWPGNVRQLEHAIERAVIMTSSQVIQPEHLQLPDLGDWQAASSLQECRCTNRYEGKTMQEILQAVERDVICQTLKREAGNKQRTAKKLGISRRALQYKIQMYGLEGIGKEQE